MSAITEKLLRIAGGHEQASGSVLDVCDRAPIAGSDRPVVVKGNRCVPPKVTRPRYLEPSSFDTLWRART